MSGCQVARVSLKGYGKARGQELKLTPMLTFSRLLDNASMENCKGNIESSFARHQRPGLAGRFTDGALTAEDEIRWTVDPRGPAGSNKTQDS